MLVSSIATGIYLCWLTFVILVSIACTYFTSTGTSSATDDHLVEITNTNSSAVSVFNDDTSFIAPACPDWLWSYCDYWRIGATGSAVFVVSEKQKQKEFRCSSFLLSVWWRDQIKGQLQCQKKLCSKGSLLVIMIHGINDFLIICLD